MSSTLQDRLHKRGGGVCAYVRKDLKSSVLKDLTSISERNFHQLWIKVQYKKFKSIIICVTYRPDDSPLSSFEELLKPCYIQALTLDKPISILGDLNCDGLNETCTEFKALENFYTDMNLKQLITKPTRITATTQSLLDVILVSSNNKVLDSGVLHRPISDHSIVFTKLKVKKPKATTQSITTQSYKNYNADNFAIDLAEETDSLLTIFDQSDVDSKLTILNDTLQSVLNAHAPLKEIKIRSRPCPFVNQEIKVLMKSRDRLLKQFTQSRQDNDWKNFKLSRDLVKEKLLEAEREYTLEEVSANKTNSSSLWKIINRAIPSKDILGPAFTKDTSVLADEFNQFFAQVGPNAAKAVLSLREEHNITAQEHSTEVTTTITTPVELFNLRTVSCEEIRQIVTSLPTNKSPGPDKISVRVLKDCLPVILGPLTDIINCSILTSTFPDNWKEAKVIPILKEGDHEVPANNRPLSLLVVASKVLERIVLNQFSAYLTQNKCLTSHQSGNKKAHSTETLNILLTDKILEAMDKKQKAALVLLDLSKAFDSIDYTRLLHKLSNIGASPSSIKWFKSYLSGRRQYVRIGSAHSKTLPIMHGVPQGAILSPLLFCIYLNDLPMTLKFCNIESYVDDSKLFMSFTLPELDATVEKLEQDLHSVAKWCCENHLLINPDKTKLLFLGTRQMLNRLQEVPRVTFLGKILKPTVSAKDLGVHLDPNLTYDHHISTVVSSCLSKLCQINRVKKSFDKTTLELLITALVFSKMFYCSSVWANTSFLNVNKLQSIQNFACRIITNTRKYDHVTPLLRELNWLPVREQLRYRDTVLVYKCQNGLAPQYLMDKFFKRLCIHNRDTRARDSLQIPLFRTKTGQRSFIFRGTNIWNNLDDDLKERTSLTSFKRALRDSLLRQTFPKF